MTVAEKHLFNSALSIYIYILDPMRKGIAMASVLGHACLRTHEIINIKIIYQVILEQSSSLSPKHLLSHFKHILQKSINFVQKYLLSCHNTLNMLWTPYYSLLNSSIEKCVFPCNYYLLLYTIFLQEMGNDNSLQIPVFSCSSLQSVFVFVVPTIYTNSLMLLTFFSQLLLISKHAQ